VPHSGKEIRFSTSGLQGVAHAASESALSGLVENFMYTQSKEDHVLLSMLLCGVSKAAGLGYVFADKTRLATHTNMSDCVGSQNPLLRANV